MSITRDRPLSLADLPSALSPSRTSTATPSPGPPRWKKTGTGNLELEKTGGKIITLPPDEFKVTDD